MILIQQSYSSPDPQRDAELCFVREANAAAGVFDHVELVEAAGRNADRGFTSAALFEVGPQYLGDAPEDQSTVAGGVRSGANHQRHWSDATGPVTVFDEDGPVAVTAVPPPTGVAVTV